MVVMYVLRNFGTIIYCESNGSYFPRHQMVFLMPEKLKNARTAANMTAPGGIALQDQPVCGGVIAIACHTAADHPVSFQEE